MQTRRNRSRSGGPVNLGSVLRLVGQKAQFGGLLGIGAILYISVTAYPYGDLADRPGERGRGLGLGRFHRQSAAGDGRTGLRRREVGRRRLGYRRRRRLFELEGLDALHLDCLVVVIARLDEARGFRRYVRFDEFGGTRTFFCTLKFMRVKMEDSN